MEQLNINPSDSLINWIFVAALIVKAHDNCSSALPMTKKVTYTSKPSRNVQRNEARELGYQGQECRYHPINQLEYRETKVDVRDCQSLDMDERPKDQ